jgi:hypothetical protein
MSAQLTLFAWVGGPIALSLIGYFTADKPEKRFRMAAAGFCVALTALGFLMWVILLLMVFGGLEVDIT